jgi:GT2 family glycosyltransferase
MTINIVIPTKNRQSCLSNVCHSICTQSIKPNKVVIIDQSENNISELTITNLFVLNDIDCLYIYNPNIAGLVEAKHFSLQYLDQDLILFLEDDVVLENDYLENVVFAFTQKPEMVGSCGIDILNKYYRFYTLFHRVFHRGLFKDMRPYNVSIYQKSLRAELRNCNILSGGISAWRSSVFKIIKFDTLNKFHSLEDIVFSLRVIRHFGIESMYFNSFARLKHHMSPVSRSSDLNAFARKIKENILLYRVYSLSKFLDFFYLVLLLIGFFIEAIVKSFQKRNLQFLNFYFNGIKEGIYLRVFKQG